MIENKIENRLRLATEKRGGLCLKFVTPGKRGAPDRIILFKGRTMFVETKAPAGILQPIQRAYHRDLELQGFNVYVVFNNEQVDNFVRYVL